MNNRDIHISHLTKHYGKVCALNDFSIDVQAGELFGLIGPDGAGKTTLFRILTTLLLADNGEATVGGWDVRRDMRKIRCSVGYMPGRFSLYPDLTVEENLNFYATIFNTTLRENYEQIVDIYAMLEPFKNRRAGQLSGGMKQKLALCCTLIHRPDILFLDEPTTGVDPVSRKELWQMLAQLKSQGMTILVSTPYMDEASLCDRIALVREGECLTVDTPEAIRCAYPHRLYAVKGQPKFPLLQALRACPETFSCYAFGDAHHLALKDEVDEAAVLRMQQRLEQNSFVDLQFDPIEPNIEDCFMNF